MKKKYIFILFSDRRRRCRRTGHGRTQHLKPKIRKRFISFSSVCLSDILSFFCLSFFLFCLSLCHSLFFPFFLSVCHSVIFCFFLSVNLFCLSVCLLLFTKVFRFEEIPIESFKDTKFYPKPLQNNFHRILEQIKIT